MPIEKLLAILLRTMISIKDFWKIEDRIREKWGKHFYKHIDFCGLIPKRDSEFTYESTPKNSITFATTGGDGVHFGLLTYYDNLKGQQPIVMTVPMMSQNVIVAENLDEFFNIGFYNGWFALEQLVYDFEGTIEYYSIPADNLSTEEKVFLDLVRTELKTNFTPLTKNRLEELRIKYYDSLDVT